MIVSIAKLFEKKSKGYHMFSHQWFTADVEIFMILGFLHESWKFTTPAMTEILHMMANIVVE